MQGPGRSAREKNIEVRFDEILFREIKLGDNIQGIESHQDVVFGSTFLNANRELRLKSRHFKLSFLAAFSAGSEHQRKAVPFANRVIAF